MYFYARFKILNLYFNLANRLINIKFAKNIHNEISDPITIHVYVLFNKKDILFLQDASDSKEYSLKYDDIRIKSDDILRIKVSSKSPELASLFSFNQLQNNVSISSIEGFQIDGYLVNSKGYINIPLLDPIKVKDLTINESSRLIQDLLSDNEILKNATVDVKIVNAYFTVLGEVNKPGRYNFLENNMDIFQALGIAGDLTINGKRNDIKIIRKDDDKLKINSIDITSSELLTSNNFQIFPGDVIIINANNARVKNAGLIGNFGNLLSVLSFILSTVILISN